jgi:hypothetical protein
LYENVSNGGTKRCRLVLQGVAKWRWRVDHIYSISYG